MISGSECDQLLQEKDIPHFALNDADAAGFAEVYQPEAVALRRGVAVVLTLGTGIGSGVFVDGKLLPNSELGMLEIHNVMAEEYAAASVIRRENLSIQSWATRLQEVINQIEIILSPDHLILGGGISSDFEQYRPFLSTKRAILAPARYRNQAGVIGAGMFAAYRLNSCSFNPTIN